MTTVEEEVNEIYEQILRDKYAFMRSFLSIADKNRKVVDFNPFRIQDGIIKRFMKHGCRGVVVKPRQTGGSTGAIGFMTVDTITVPSTTSVVVAYEEFITERLLQKSKFFYDEIPPTIEIKPGIFRELKPEMHSDSKHEKTFPSINSTLYIGTARSATFGRGDTIHNFLGDEYAFWPDVEKIMVPVLQAVPPSGRVLLLSTPNGEDNAFHDLYIEARDDENSIWTADFYPWYYHEEYFLRANDLGVLPRDRVENLAFITEQEQKLIDIGVTEDQIRWRRFKEDELRKLQRTQTSVLSFGQEYPEDDIACWMTAGNMVYDADLLSDMALRCEMPIDKFKGTWEVSYTDSDVLNIWEHPKEGVIYVIGLDPGMGRQTLTAISVWRYWIEYSEDPDKADDLERGKLVASMYGLIEPEDTAEIVKQVGNYYNHALLVPEANNHGLAVLTNLRDYGNIYLREELNSGKITKKLGWESTKRTKPTMINLLRANLDYLEILDIRMVSQFANIRRIFNPNTQEWVYKAVGGDDIHDSAALANIGKPEMIVARGYAGQAGYSDNWGFASEEWDEED